MQTLKKYSDNTLITILGILIAYGAIHSVIRLLASDNLGEHDAVFQIYGQNLSYFYSESTRPLYIWLIWIVQRLTGPTVLSFLIVKYTLLVIIGYLIYSATFIVSQNKKIAILSVESLALIYQIFWRYHESYTDIILFMLFSLSTFWILIKLSRKKSYKDIILTGIFISLGLLSHPYFDGFLIVLLVTYFSSKKIWSFSVFQQLLVMAVCLIIVVPYYTFTPADFFYGNLGAIEHKDGILRGLISGFAAPAWSLMPYFPLILFIAPSILKPVRVNSSIDILFKKYAFFLFSAGALYSIFLGSLFRIPSQDLLGFTLPFAIYLSSQISQSHDNKEPSRIIYLAIFISLISLSLRAANMFILDPICNKCRWGIPYNHLAGELGKHVTSAPCLIMTSDNIETVANLIRNPLKFDVIRAESDHKNQCSEVIQLSAPNKIIRPSGIKPNIIHNITIPWDHIYRQRGYRTTTWEFSIIYN